MSRNASCVCIAVLGVLFANVARAQDDFSREGCFVGLGPGGVVSKDNSGIDVGLDARIGCRTGLGGGELHYEWINGTAPELEGWALSLDGKVYPLWLLESRLPALARRVQPFATLGFGYLALDGAATKVPGNDDWDFLVRVGGGLDVYLTRNIALSADATYAVPTANDSGAPNYLSLGWRVLYRF